MGKINWSLTSGFTKKLGNVVGFNWKGQNILRALVPVKNSKTESQQLQRGKFGFLGNLSGIVYDAIVEGYRLEANKNRSTQSGLFIKNNMDIFSGNTRDELAVDLSALQLSDGKLKGVVCGTPAISGTILTVEVRNTAAINRRATLADRVYICAYCPKLEDAVCACVGTRQGGSFELTVPAEYAFELVHVYAFVVGAASTNDGVASPTIYLGTAGEGTATPSTGSGTGSNTGGNSETPSNGGSETPSGGSDTPPEGGGAVNGEN